MRLSFVKWLHQQALHDPDRSMPYARAYEIGPLIESVMVDETPIPPKPKRARKKAGAATEKAAEPEPADKIVKADYPCGYRGIDGKNCPRRAVAGTARCEMHGGAITDPDVRRSILLSSYARLMEGSAAAVAALIDVVNESRNDLARVQAARELLDRAGLVQDQHVHLHVADPSEDGGALTELRSRLDEIRSRLSTPLGEIAAAPATPVSKESTLARDSEVIEAEIIS
jgi:hypothetical protein